MKPHFRQAGAGKTVLLVSVGMAALMAAVLLTLWLKNGDTQMPGSMEHPAMAAAHYSPRDVVGDLGGVPVTIPRHFANYVEYDGDPGWGEKRKGPPPERTHQSRLRSFGYYTRFPDMAGESSGELIKDKGIYSSYTTPWISVGITTGSYYPGDGFLDRLTAQIGKSGSIHKYRQHERLTEPVHGLTVYGAAGIDPKTNQPYRDHPNAKDIFVHRDKTSRVDAYIDCVNQGGSQPCKHIFSLEPYMHAEVYVLYRRSLLPQWREIQQAVTRQILGFRTLPANPVAAKP